MRSLQSRAESTGCSSTSICSSPGSSVIHPCTSDMGCGGSKGKETDVHVLQLLLGESSFKMLTLYISSTCAVVLFPPYDAQEGKEIQIRAVLLH